MTIWNTSMKKSPARCCGDGKNRRLKDYVAVSHQLDPVNIEGERKKHSSTERQVSTVQLEVRCEIPGFHAFHV
jgi:hypothetical protein